MSSSETPVVPKTPEDASEAVKANVPLSSILLMSLLVAAIVLVVAAGAVFYMLRAGKLRNTQTVCEPVPAMAQSAHTRALVMEPLVVNLGDAGGRAYLRLAATLRVEDPADAPEVASKPRAAGKGQGESADDVAAIRDTMLDVLGASTADVLLAAEGKEQLKARLLQALAAHVPAVKVKQVYFTEFLVQR